MERCCQWWVGCSDESHSPDFVVLHPAGHISCEHRQVGETLNDAVRHHLRPGRPGMGTVGYGPLRLWYRDLFRPDLPSNPRRSRDREAPGLPPRQRVSRAGSSVDGGGLGH